MRDKVFTDLYIENGFSFKEAISEIDFICDALYDFGYDDYLRGKTLSEEQREKIKKIIIERVKTRKPMQHVIGVSFFCGEKFEVSEETLVPRPETEILVEEVLRLVSKTDNLCCLDIGTGTGCIPVCCVLKNNNIKFDACDISEKALKTAKNNADVHGVSDKIKFICSDLFENISSSYDLIVSNPPYIPLKDKDILDVEVKDYDPERALFAPDEDGVYFYGEIIRKSCQYLKKSGFLVFELGINQCRIVKEMMERQGFGDINIIKDLNGIERVISGRFI